MAEAISSDYDEIELSEAVKLISENAQDITIHNEKIKKTAELVMDFWMKKSGQFPSYNYRFTRPESYPKEKIVIKADWLFVLHTLNFSLWYPKNITQWKVEGKMGYFGLCRAIERAHNEGIAIWQPSYYSKITRSDFEHIFKSDDGETCIPLIDERIKILHEVGGILMNKYQGTFDKCIRECDYDADKLTKLVVDEFESYRDEVIYDGKKVRFLLKARALMSDLWDNFKIKPKFKLNIGQIMYTIFIEYTIPQLFYESGLLTYNEKLKERIENNEPLEYGSREEIEIRGCILFIVQELCKEVHRISWRYKEQLPILNRKSCNIPIIVVNFLLEHMFILIDQEYFKNSPFHYIRTVHY